MTTSGAGTLRLPRIARSNAAETAASTYPGTPSLTTYCLRARVASVMPRPS